MDIRSNQLLNEMKEKSFFSLDEMMNNPESYTEEELIACKLELEKRGYHKYSLPTENESIAEKGANEDTGFPPKPAEEVKSQSIYKSIISMALFAGIFYLVFKWELTFILVLVGVILIHELGHYIAMRAFNYQNLGIFFVPLVGAFASGSKEKVSQKQEVIIFLSGPLPGVIIGMFVFYFGLLHNNEFLLKTGNIFIFLNLFNLLPIMPLDGGRIVKTMFFDNNNIIAKIFTGLSIIVAVYFCIKTESYFLLIIPYLLIMQLVNQSQVNKARVAIRNKGLDINKGFSEISNEEYWLIRDELGLHIRAFNRFISPKVYATNDKEQKIITQVKAILISTTAKDLRISGKLLISLVLFLIFVLPLSLIFLNHLIF